MEIQHAANEHDWVTNIGEAGGGQAPATIAFGPSPRLASPAFALHAGQDRLGTQEDVDEEDRRQLHRELTTAKQDRTRVINRIKGLLAGHGV